MVMVKAKIERGEQLVQIIEMTAKDVYGNGHNCRVGNQGAIFKENTTLSNLSKKSKSDVSKCSWKSRL